MEKTICLHGYGYQAEIVPDRGANLISLTRCEITSVRTPERLSDLDQISPFFFGTPLLFPPNRIAGASFVFEGREYRFPVNEEKTGCFIHGSLHKESFVCVSHQDTEAVFLYQASRERPYLTFPHEFTMIIQDSLEPDGYHRKLSLRNDSALNMPFAIGYHTTFSLPISRKGRAEDVRLSLDIGREIVRSSRNYLPTGEVLAGTPLQEELKSGNMVPCLRKLSAHYEMGSRREMCLRDQVRHVSIRYRCSEDFRYWMLYSGGDYQICVEPQTWMINSPNAPFSREESGFSFLKPGESRTLETVLSLEQGND